MASKIQEKLIDLFKEWSGKDAEIIIPLPQSGSSRKYYRIKKSEISAIGAFNPDRKENNAFVTFAKHLKEKGLPVPEIYKSDLENDIYLVEDLGNLTLFDFSERERSDKTFPKIVIEKYKEALSYLLKFQIGAKNELDFSVCYPRAHFDKQAMLWDLNYFKYYFLKLANIHFDEQLLENDFNLFTDYLSKAQTNFFMYRDFQTRNIMLKNNELYFLDFQGGRKGALQYDVASLLYSSKSNLPQNIREKLLDHYINELTKYSEADIKNFKEYFPGYVLIRILQAMGAYGFRGFYERKDHFLKSIPYAVKNIELILNKEIFINKFPELKLTLQQIAESDYLKSFGRTFKSDKLKITVTSFSYKQGIPYDTSGNGGGFVFDCRAIHNPGRYDQYKSLTGKNKSVKEFLENKSNVLEFLKNVYSLIDESIVIYQKRDFKNLMINFGCTGGQHRSVYCAEKTADYLKNKYDVNIDLFHTQLNKRSDL